MAKLQDHGITSTVALIQETNQSIRREGRKRNRMKVNKVKRALDHGGVAIGTMMLEFSTTGIARIAAEAGSEFAVFDMEHTGWSMETIRMLMATLSGGRNRADGPRAGPAISLHLPHSGLRRDGRRRSVRLERGTSSRDRQSCEVSAGRPPWRRLRGCPRRLPRGKPGHQDAQGQRRGHAHRSDRECRRSRARRPDRGGRRHRRSLDRPVRPLDLTRNSRSASTIASFRRQPTRSSRPAASTARSPSWVPPTRKPSLAARRRVSHARLSDRHLDLPERPARLLSRRSRSAVAHHDKHH